MLHQYTIVFASLACGAMSERNHFVVWDNTIWTSWLARYLECHPCISFKILQSLSCPRRHATHTSRFRSRLSSAVWKLQTCENVYPSHACMQKPYLCMQLTNTGMPVHAYVLQIWTSAFNIWGLTTFRHWTYFWFCNIPKWQLIHGFGFMLLSSKYVANEMFAPQYQSR